MNLKKIAFDTDNDANLGLLILRIFIGAAMFTHGLAKLQGGVAGFTQNVANMGIPAAQLLGPLAVFAESAGAILLAIGLLTRPAAFLLVCTMAVAVFKVTAAKASRPRKPPGSTSSRRCSSCSRAPASGRWMPCSPRRPAEHEFRPDAARRALACTSARR